VRMVTMPVIPSRTVNSRGLTSLCLLISLMMVACAVAPQTPEKLALADPPKAASSVHPPDAGASYHFMLDTKLSLRRTWIVRFENTRLR